MQRLLKENFLSEKDLYAELPELLSDKKSSRESDKERIFIRAIGLVNQDIVMANAIYQSTPKKGIGTRSVMIHRGNRFKSRAFHSPRKHFKAITPHRQSVLKFFREQFSQLLN